MLRDLPDFDPSSLGPSQSYSTRPRPETPQAVLCNRVGVTATLFGVAMSVSWLLGRTRP